MKKEIPRIVIAGVHSNVGKTTVMVALIQLFKERGLKVCSFKCGPDYLDPTYHKRVSGNNSINLDSWMMGKMGVLKTFNKCSEGYDIALIEGVMGLFDGADPKSEEGSTAQIAKILNAPVILLADASGMARSISALFQGFKNFDPDLKLKGAILNRLGSERHLEILEEALGIEYSFGGILKGKTEFAFESRHLGLRTATSHSISKEILTYWKDHCAQYINLDKIIQVAHIDGEYEPLKEFSKVKKENITISYALDEAFHFYYPENLNTFRELGANLIPFSPIKDKEIPPGTDFIYLGGGYPELYAEELSKNHSMLKSIRDFANNGGGVYGECGGLIYLSEELTLSDGRVFPMLKLLDLKIEIALKLKSLGYTFVEFLEDSFLGKKGEKLRGHQFRYSDYIDNASSKIMKLTKKRGNIISNEGFQNKNVIGTYVHSHFASNPNIPKNIVNWVLKQK